MSLCHLHEHILRNAITYVLYAPMKVLEWIDTSKLYKPYNWKYLSGNPNAVTLLEQNQDKIHWDYASSNPGAVPLIKNNMDKVKWDKLARDSSMLYKPGSSRQ